MLKGALGQPTDDSTFVNFTVNCPTSQPANTAKGGPIKGDMQAQSMYHHSQLVTNIAVMREFDGGLLSGGAGKMVNDVQVLLVTGLAAFFEPIFERFGLW